MNDYIYPPPPTLPPGSAVIAYTRDSGGPNQQESRGQQERVILEYCKTHGLMLSRIYSETASGRKTKHRDQFLEMCNSVMTCTENAKPRGLILWAYSRFSRDIVDFNFYLYGLLKRGLIIHSLTEQIPEGLAGQILLSIKAFTNADYSIQLGKQIKRSIADRVKAGFNNGGTAPKGYRIVRELHDSRRNGTPRIGVKWEIDPDLAPLIRKAWELRARGESYTAITKATQGKIYTSTNSWSSHFRNESYTGTGKAGEERIPDHHEPLITFELWDAVKRVEAENKKQYHRREVYPSLLAGLAYCVHCGAAMVIHTSKVYRAYICGKHDRRKGYSDCPNSHRVNAPKVEKLILECVYTRILSGEFINDILAEVQSHIDDKDKIDREIGEITHTLIHVEKQIKNLVQLAADTGNIEEVKTSLTELKLKQAEYIARIKSLKAEKEKATPHMTHEALMVIFDAWRAQLQSAVENKEITIAKKLLNQFVQRIELGNNKAIIHYTFPLSESTEDVKYLRAHTFFGVRFTSSVEIDME